MGDGRPLRRWYHGEVTSHNEDDTHTITYKDGDVRDEDLRAARWRLVVPSEPPPPAPPPGAVSPDNLPFSDDDEVLELHLAPLGSRVAVARGAAEQLGRVAAHSPSGARMLVAFDDDAEADAWVAESHGWRLAADRLSPRHLAGHRAGAWRGDLLRVPAFVR